MVYQVEQGSSEHVRDNCQPSQPQQSSSFNEHFHVLQQVCYFIGTNPNLPIEIIMERAEMMKIQLYMEINSIEQGVRKMQLELLEEDYDLEITRHYAEKMENYEKLDPYKKTSVFWHKNPRFGERVQRHEQQIKEYLTRKGPIETDVLKFQTRIQALKKPADTSMYDLFKHHHCPIASSNQNGVSKALQEQQTNNGCNSSFVQSMAPQSFSAVFTGQNNPRKRPGRPLKDVRGNGEQISEAGRQPEPTFVCTSANLLPPQPASNPPNDNRQPRKKQYEFNQSINPTVLHETSASTKLAKKRQYKKKQQSEMHQPVYYIAQEPNDHDYTTYRQPFMPLQNGHQVVRTNFTAPSVSSNQMSVHHQYQGTRVTDSGSVKINHTLPQKQSRSLSSIVIPSPDSIERKESLQGSLNILGDDFDPEELAMSLFCK